MKWFQRDREERPAGVVPLSGVVKSESAPGQAPPPLAAGGPVLQRIGGHSDQVARMTTPAEPVILDITHQGRGHFVVDALDAGLHSQSQLVYTDGPFACRALVNADDRTVRALRVQADGPWAIEATAVSSAAALDGAARCPASNVLRYEGGPGIASLCHEGDPRAEDGGYFLVDTYAPDGNGFLDELANHVGPWRGEAPLTGPCLIYARSDGPWSISVQPL
ncbi:hypothetical protein GCM10010348_33840 [Streptomyces anthocyanicus]|uniref:hypothetical protein n=1 Tax=Streptomyces TaxID=1883 RepID=UPI001876C04B|nr:MULTISPECIES: hypothetical protein [Streptomyces]MBQ0950899.1 hypothetical protein [Streptomyces sp. RK76]GHC08751.1 hypothetical protein GCM10010348_33840 [Streptomyces anthocyanicus]